MPACRRPACRRRRLLARTRHVTRLPVPVFLLRRPQEGDALHLRPVWQHPGCDFAAHLPAARPGELWACQRVACFREARARQGTSSRPGNQQQARHCGYSPAQRRRCLPLLQAWVVFEKAEDARKAMEAMQGFPFFDKPIVSCGRAVQLLCRVSCLLLLALSSACLPLPLPLPCPHVARLAIACQQQLLLGCRLPLPTGPLRACPMVPSLLPCSASLWPRPRAMQ